MGVLYDGELPVHYGFGFLGAADGETPDLDEARSGQANGLLGARVPGALSIMFGLHTGPEPLRVEWVTSEPTLDKGWEEIVEATIDIASTEVLLSAFDHFIPLTVPETGPQTSQIADYWHREATGQAHPVLPERAEQNQLASALRLAGHHAVRHERAYRKLRVSTRASSFRRATARTATGMMSWWQRG